MGDCNKRDCSGWNEKYDHNCWHMDPSTYDHCFEPLKEKTASGSKVPCSVGLSAPAQAIEALEKLAEYWENTGADSEASSNREYINVIKGQVICRKLVEKEKGI